MASEAEIQRAILREFGSGHPGLRVWRMNTGVAKRADGGVVRFGTPGQADISGIVSVGGRGVRLEIEVKSATGKQSADQKSYQSMITRLGGIYILARSVDDVKRALENLL